MYRNHVVLSFTGIPILGLLATLVCGRRSSQCYIRIQSSGFRKVNLCTAQKSQNLVEYLKRPLQETTRCDRNWLLTNILSWIEIVMVCGGIHENNSAGVSEENTNCDSLLIYWYAWKNVILYIILAFHITQLCYMRIRYIIIKNLVLHDILVIYTCRNFSNFVYWYFLIR